MKFAVFDENRGEWLSRRLFDYHEVQPSNVMTTMSEFARLCRGEIGVFDHLFIHQTDIPVPESVGDLGEWLITQIPTVTCRHVWVYSGGGLQENQVSRIGHIRPIRFGVPRSESTVPERFILLLRTLDDQYAELVSDLAATSLTPLDVLCQGYIAVSLLNRGDYDGLAAILGVLPDATVLQELMDYVDHIGDAVVWFEPGLQAIRDAISIEGGVDDYWAAVCRQAQVLRWTPKTGQRYKVYNAPAGWLFRRSTDG